MINIKLSIPNCAKGFSVREFLGSHNINNQVRFFINSTEDIDFDFWFVIDDLENEYESARVDPEGVYFFTSEVIHDPCYYDTLRSRIFLDQFKKIYTSHDIYIERAHCDLPYQGWMINANHGASVYNETGRGFDYLLSVERIKKTKLLSVICSTKAVTPYHRLRLKFVRHLKEHFGDRLDWFGNGVDPISSKWDGIAPYKYHICIENKPQHNVITEKICDSFLGLAFPLYFGAPNITDFFSENSFQSINVFEPYSAIDQIEKILSNDHYEDNIVHLRKSRDCVLYDINPFMRMAKIAIHDFSKRLFSDKKTIKMNSLVSRSLSKRAIRAAGRKIERAGSFLSQQT